MNSPRNSRHVGPGGGGHRCAVGVERVGVDHDSIGKMAVPEIFVFQTAQRNGVRRTLYWCIAAVGLLYAPLAFGYAWHLFAPETPRLHDAVTGLVAGREYAVGQYSVEWVRADDYAAHPVLILLHTSLGALALTLIWPQMSHTIRTRRPTVHRWTGRVYFVLMAASMGAAITFLLLRPPADYPGFTAFDLQLWTLALATLCTGGLALRAIRHGDILTHRAWMGFHTALMMTAPLLRILWIILAPLRPEYHLLTNLGAGSIMLGVIAPAGGAVAFMLTVRSREHDDEQQCGPAIYVVLVATAVIGSFLFATYHRPLLAMGRTDLLSVHLVPAWVYLLICAVGVARARRAGLLSRERLWRWMMTGAASASAAAAFVGIVRDAHYDNMDGFAAGAMIGPALPITVSFALGVRYVANAWQALDRPRAEQAMSLDRMEVEGA